MSGICLSHENSWRPRLSEGVKKISKTSARFSASALSRRFLFLPPFSASFLRVFSSSSSQFHAPARAIPSAMVPGARSTGGVAHSASNSAANAGSPSGRSRPGKGAAAAAVTTSASTSTPARGNTVARRLNDLEIKGDGAPSPQTAASKKKKKGAHVVGPDKGNRGLRQFSMKVCEKVESKGRTTYNEVADELVAEFSDPNSNIGSPDPDNPNTQQYDEKNIRRRVYDALNVLMAMDIIYKDKKEIQWKGLPRTSMSDIDKLKIKLIGQKGRIDKKSAYLQELQDQYVGLQNLVERNEHLYSSGDTPSGGVALPFILVQTRPHATVEVEISEDMQLVHLDFNSTPFELHDDSFVLKAMGLSGKEETDGTLALVANGIERSRTPNVYPHRSPQPARRSGLRLQTSPPIPGILKGRVKHEH